MKFIFVMVVLSGSAGSLLAQRDSVLYLKAAHFVSAENLDSAIAAFRQIASLKDSPFRLNACLSLGRLYFESLHDYPKALMYYDTVYVEFFHHPGRAHAVFMLGYIYANALKDYRRAEGYYSEFLRTYPDHELASSVRFELDHLGEDLDSVLGRDADD